MRILLDTHAIIWYFEHNDKLSQKAEAIIDNPENNIYICTASLWEIAIKVSLGKLNISFNGLLDELEKVGFLVLHTENEYLQRLLDLPLIHKDPFDRLIISTAIVENMTLISADENVHKYNVTWIW